MNKMIQILGTSSNAGKTLLVMSLCRYFSNLGIRVSPFKSLNLSLNSISLPDGSEISRSVWLQAKAARTEPDFHMNPYLLKPEGHGVSQVIVNGKVQGYNKADNTENNYLDDSLNIIREDLQYLFSKYEIVIAEGAGSPAEINMLEHDVANIKVSQIWNTPAILIGDIDRGGIFASMYGTLELMEGSRLVRGMIINNMRGDVSLLSEGIKKIENMTSRPVLGVIPHIDKVKLPGEDSLDYIHQPSTGRICVIKYPHMENLSEVDPLILLGIPFTYVTWENPEILEKADAIILPGSKRVDLDLEYLKLTKLSIGIVDAVNRGALIFGICGGYQMLGNKIEFQDQEKGELEGLAILDVDTKYEKNKTTRPVTGKFIDEASGLSSEFHGYEIHYGKVVSREEKPLLLIDGIEEGAVSRSGRVIGTNIHGLLENMDFLSKITGTDYSNISYEEVLDRNIEVVSGIFTAHLDMESIKSMLEL